MKSCPTCGISYSDDLSFCLQDGTGLDPRSDLDPTHRPTLILRPDPDKNNDISMADTIAYVPNTTAPKPKLFQMSAVEPSTRMGCALTIGQVAAGLIIVVGLGFAGLVYNFRTDNDVARIDPPTPNRPTISTANSFSNLANKAVNTGTTPPSPSRTGLPKTIRGEVLNSQAVSLPAAIYPPAARAVKAAGKVDVQVLIDETGRVISAKAVSGHPLLRSAAKQAARSARFKPSSENGQPMPLSGVIEYEFTPQ